MTELEQVHDYEEENYRLARNALGPAVDLAQGSVELYELMVQICTAGPAKLGTDDLLILSFLSASKYELTMASLDTLRCHLLASYPHTRRALELCAFAAHVKNELDIVKLWASAGDNDDTYRAYSRAFKPRKVFPEDHPLLGPLYARYSECSRLSHPSIYSVGSQTQMEKKVRTTDVQVHYFQGKEDGADLFRTFLWTIDTHVRIIAVFEETLADLLCNDPKRWAIHRDAFTAQFLVHRKRLQALLESRPPTEPERGALIWTP